MDKYVKTLIESQLSKTKKVIEKETEPETEIEEIVDEKGNIMRSKKPLNINVKGITQKKTTDQVVKTAHGQMGATDGFSNRMTRYWGESDMSKLLGYKKTLGKDEDLEDAEDYFEKDLGLSDEEAKEKLTQMGYDEKLPNGKVRLVENPKKFIEQYIDEILAQRDKESKSKGTNTLNPILKKQLDVIKKTINNDQVSVKDILDYLKK